MKSKEIKDNIRDRVKLLPSLPGVYRFYNKEGTIIYVGKAKSLKNRVSQYFLSEEGLSAKTRVMVSKIDHFEHTIVENESEALLLENNLIKEHQPRYNILLKDGKTYPWICIKNEHFPRIMLTRRFIRDGSFYYGPYSNVSYAYSLIELIGTLFFIRNCKLVLSPENIKTKNYRPCLSYHLGKCKAPCIGAQSPDNYNLQIDKIKLILKGDTASLVKEMKKDMSMAAKELRFEDAHALKEKLEILGRHYSKSMVVSQNITNVDVFSIVFENNLAFGNYMRVVNGSVVQSLNVEFKLPLEEEQSAVLTRFIVEMRNKFGPLSKELITSFAPDEAFENSRVNIPQRGEKLSLLELSLKNARLFKLEKIKQEEILRPEEHKERILNSIRKDLDLKELPVHIECFDNSNIQGSFAVSACVVFRNGVPSKQDYRHFNVKKVVGANDFATMKEVVNRRYSRLLSEGSTLPQLVVIDGGRGQVNAAYEALSELGLEKDIQLLGIAKRLEELIIPGDPHPLFLDKNSATLRVIMNLRDEAHRFGITHHRNKRSKGQIESELRSISGLGEKSEQKLLSKFHSVKGVRSASFDDLKEVVGQKAANIIRNYFKSGK
ncbi:MAG: excinuclease ABC subunit UvrC [Bacteroidales bacterium]|jgi:excinuclease ABC subunit C|nr:excinuclease ABC subunit UvrC [Bacteroidales bacterium]MDD4292763.1 excinuclease ABC subunit UvrC [Bacteroidales bacterium]MDD4491066.1 excinuclease ABC subunit UvrC [Bacteroidales bacterium]HPS95313.1 excinuclease ABC subunit UvrC [Bacteroidales bacterium]